MINKEILNKMLTDISFLLDLLGCISMSEELQQQEYSRIIRRQNSLATFQERFHHLREEKEFLEAVSNAA